MGEEAADRSEHTSRGRWLVDRVILLAVLALVTALMVTGGRWRPAGMVLSGVDVAGHYAWLRSPLLDGDFEFGNDYEGIMEPHVFEAHRDPLPATGRHANPFPIGCAVALLPGFLLTHGLLSATALGESWPSDGFSLPYGIAAYWSLWVWAAAGLFLTHAWLRRRWPRDVALIATCLTWLATGAAYYTFPTLLNNHSLGLAAMPLFLLTWERWEEGPSRGRALAAGIACGLLFLVRWQLVLWPVIFWITALVQHVNRPAGEPRRTGLLLVPLVGLIVASPQFAAWHHIYGSWLTKPQGDQYILWHRPMVHLLLFSLHRGWIAWTPIVAVAVVGWVAAWRRDRLLIGRIAVGLLLQLYISSVVVDWHGAWGYAARRLTHTTPLLALGIAAVLALAAAGGRRRLAWASAGLSVFVVWNALFLVQIYHHLVPFHRPLTWHEFFTDKLHVAASLDRREAVLQVIHLCEEAREAIGRGDEAEANELLDGATRWLIFAQSADPHHEDVYLAAAAFALEVGDSPSAMRAYEACLRDLGVDRPQILTSMGVAALYAEQAEAAASLARSALAERPDYGRAQALLDDALDGRRDEQHSYFFF